MQLKSSVHAAQTAALRYLRDESGGRRLERRSEDASATDKLFRGSGGGAASVGHRASAAGER